MPKINLYIYHPYSGFGGADRSIARLINNLPSKRYRIFFITNKKPNIKVFINKKIKYISLKSTKTIFAFFKLKKFINNQINNDEKNIFISNQNFANVLSILFLKSIKKLKIILIERNSLEELRLTADFFTSLKSFIIKILMKLLYHKSDLVICISKNLKNEISKFCRSKTTYIYNPALDNNILKKITPKKLYKTNKIKLLNVGRLERQKDQITILKAINILKDKYNFELNIVGYGKDQKKLKQFIRKNNLKKIVKIHVNVFNAENFLKSSNIFILSSLYEGFGNVLLEAAKYKLPIISSNCKHGPKEILGNGKYGYLFPVRNYKQLSKILIEYFKNKKTFIKKSNLMHKSLKRFKTDISTKKYSRIFERI